MTPLHEILEQLGRKVPGFRAAGILRLRDREILATLRAAHIADDGHTEAALGYSVIAFERMATAASRMSAPMPTRLRLETGADVVCSRLVGEGYLATVVSDRPEHSGLVATVLDTYASFVDASLAVVA